MIGWELMCCKGGDFGAAGGGVVILESFWMDLCAD
jgi:hypothetical protein